MLARAYMGQGKSAKANEAIESAIGISPDNPYLFYIKAHILLDLGHKDMAINFIEKAIEMNPVEAAYHALHGHLKLVKKQFEPALESANTALNIDAENLMALNVRSSALNKLRRFEESSQTIEGALREDPNNSFTHANYGWSLLEKGDYKKAKHHFKESLINDPNYAYAQAGLMESIKATNPVYRMFLKYSFWMGNLSARYQWGVIIGFYIGFRVIRGIAQKNENLAPYLTPVIVLLALIAFSTWIINPISNLFLRFNKYGKLLLDRKERISSNLVAISLLILAAGVILYFISMDTRMLMIAAFGFAMMPALGTMFAPSKTKNALLYYTIALAVAGILAISSAFLSGNSMNGFAVLFVFGFIAYQWIVNFMLIKEDNN